MSFYDILPRRTDDEWLALFGGSSIGEIEKAILAENPTPRQFASLLSPAAEPHLEKMAGKARATTLKHFGRTIQLFTPIYLSNYCDNTCAYCGFNSANDIARKRLSPEEVEKEAAFLASTGLRHILVLTGESRRMSPVDYMKDCVRVLRTYFSSLSVEVYPLTEEEYAGLIKEGVDGLTIYQEVYDETIYKRLHGAGPKSDYRFRLDAPERGARAGMRNVTIGTLFGLDDWRREVFLTGLHAQYLQASFPDVEIGASIPRIRPHAGSFVPAFTVTDKNIVQAILALRMFLPRLSLSVSTRESPSFRDNIIPLGITRMSAGSMTCVGGHTSVQGAVGEPQFEISDKRSVADIMAMLRGKGYQPVLKDWMRI